MMPRILKWATIHRPTCAIPIGDKQVPAVPHQYVRRRCGFLFIRFDPIQFDFSFRLRRLPAPVADCYPFGLVKPCSVLQNLTHHFLFVGGSTRIVEDLQLNASTTNATQYKVFFDHRFAVYLTDRLVKRTHFLHDVVRIDFHRVRVIHGLFLLETKDNQEYT